MRPHLFLDVDGVMADFDAHVTDRFGAGPQELGTARLWQLVESESDFWSSIPLKAGARELWELAKDHDPTFLTGCPRTSFDMAAAHKRHWLRQHFGDVPVITCLSRDKASHMKAPGDILVDDFIANVRRWQKAGGRAIWYRNAGQALNELRRALDKGSPGA